MSRGDFKSFAEACADSRLARRVRQEHLDAPMFIPDSDPEAQVYYVLTPKGEALAEALARELELDRRFGPLTED